MARLHPGVVYTLGRLAVFAGSVGVLALLGFRSWALLLGAAVLYAVGSIVLLRRQREAFARALAERAAERRAEKEKLRTLLRGDDEPPT